VTLFESIRTYVERKRSFGLGYEQSARNLWSFSKQVGDVALGCVTPRQVSAFLNGPHTSTVTWRAKYNLLKHFFEYWAARGMLQTLPIPLIRPPCLQTFFPHIYSRTEIRLLLRSTRFSQKRHACKIGSQTQRTLLLFLYGTGALTGEALRLGREDVDLSNDLVTIRGKRFNRVRRIPIGPDLHKRLRRYVDSASQKKNQGKNFFANRDGTAIKARILGKSFERLRRVSGIARHDGAHYQPRMHDLRHTFAVHRLTAWFKQGADVNRMLPALAAYIGQVGLGSTERYLSMTPERFRKQLVKLSPNRRRRRWRDNAALMKFLSEL
jgi:integrase/recombinase XerD